MPSSPITGLTNLATMQPSMLMYAGLSPFGVTDDRKITASALLTTISPLTDGTSALTVTNSATPTVPQVVFTNIAGTKRMQIAMAGAVSITDTDNEVSIFSSVAAHTLSMGMWNAIDTGEAVEFYMYAGAAGLDHLRLRQVDSGGANTNLFDIPKSGILLTSNTDTGGLVICAQETNAPIIFATGNNTTASEKGRFNSAGLTLGHVSTITGALNLANSASAFLTTITAGNAAAARTYVWPTNFGASGTVLTDAAGNGTLSWAAASSGTVNAGTQYQIAYYPASAAAVSGLSTLNTDASNRILFSAASISVPVAIADAAPIATNAALGNRFTVSSAVDRTLGIPTNPTNGQQCSWSWTNTAGAPHTLTLTTGSAGAFRYNGTITVLPTTAAGKKLMFTAVYDSTADRWDVQGYVNDI